MYTIPTMYNGIAKNHFTNGSPLLRFSPLLTTGKVMLTISFSSIDGYSSVSNKAYALTRV